MEFKTALDPKSKSKTASDQPQPANAARSITPSIQAALLQDQRPAISLSSSAEAGPATSHEQEADRAADVVTHMPISAPRQTHPPSSQPASAGSSGLGTGRPLSAPLRHQFDHAFGWDFSGVRLHTGSAAAQAATSKGARAFTSGNDITFSDKVGNPESSGQRRVLAHELAHVVQQGKSGDTQANRAPAQTAAGSPLASSLSAAPAGEVQADPLVTDVTSLGEIGVGRSLEATATAAGNRPLDWTLLGAPAGVTVVPRGRRGATIRANAASIASAGATFNVQASLRGAVPPDTHQRATPITLVGITALTFTANPAIGPVAGVAPPANSAEPNRGGLAGNTAAVNITTLPAPRPLGTTVTLRTPLGATVMANTITPGTQTGNVNVRVTDNATGTFRDEVLIINPVPTHLSGLTAPAAAGPYGVTHNMNFASSDRTGNVLDRVVGETITGGGRDDFGRLAVVNAPQGGPNPAPILALAAPANAATDTVLTGAGANMGAAGDANPINVNRYIGPGVAATLPQMTIYRQSLHFLSWTGAVWSNEFDLGMHRKTLRGAGANGFLSEQIFPRTRATPFAEAYAGPPLITLSAVTANTAAAPAAPLAAGLAADGVATAVITVVSSVGGRNVIWRVLRGNIATVPMGAAPVAAGAAGVAGGAGLVRSGLTPGNYTLRVEDSVFPNRRVEGTIRVVPVTLRGINAPVTRVPAGTLTAIVNVNADPGGRNLNWTVDPRAVLGGVTVVGTPVAAAAAALPARTATVTRPAAFVGEVTVTAADTLRPARRASIKIRFL